MSDTLKKLRVLTEKLTIRDKKRVQELSLYQSFFETIPVKTFVWSVDSELNVRIKNKKGLKNHGCSSLLPNGSLFDAFSCEKMNNVNIDYHKKALAGTKQTYLSYESNVTFLTTLVPVTESGENVVYGCSWDITNLINISKAVKTIHQSDQSGTDELLKAINETPIFQLIKELEV